MLHITFPGLIYFISGSVYLPLDPFTHFAPWPSGNHQAGSLSLCTLFFFFFKISHMSEVVKYLSFFIDLFHLAQCPHGPSLFLQMIRLPFLWLNNILYFLYSFIHRWTIRMLVNNAVVNMGVQVHFWVSIFVSRSGITQSYSISIWRFLRNLHTVSIVDEWFIFPPTVHQGSLFFTSLPILVLPFFDNSHSNSCEVGDSSLWFWLAFPLWLVTLSTFFMYYWPPVCPYCKNVYSVLLTIL